MVRLLSLVVALASGISVAAEPTVGPLKSIAPHEFVKLSGPEQAVYVSGVLDGMSFTSYGYGLPEHDQFVRCSQTITLGALAKKTVAFLQANPKFSESTSSAVAQAYGSHCKAKGFR